MPRYRLTLEYDGRPFAGWQIQADLPTVQGVLEVAFAAFAGEAVAVHGAGRTDAGVHARGQVAHIDLTREWMAERIQGALNFHLKPHPIAVLAVARVPDTFEARFSAIERRYRYRILARRARPALDAGHVWWIPRRLDADAMAAGARHFLGRHDFTTFRAAGCQAPSPVRTLDRCDVTRAGDEIIIDVAARSFLHNQVRSMVGSLALVGDGRWAPAEIAAALVAKDRARCGPVAPPGGLYLMAVRYPDDPVAQ
jgi:tRNA pseudouridine38-40 synthase